MANNTPAKFTKQLGPMVTPEFAAELEADARAAEVSVSTLVRQMLEESMIARRAERAVDARWQGDYDDALMKTLRQGAEHVRAHRDRDRAARGAAPAHSAPVKAAAKRTPRKAAAK